MKKTILLLAVILFTFSCESNEWNAENKKAFMDACNSDGTIGAYCECYLDNLIENDINVLESSMLTSDEANRIGEPCFDKL